MGGQIILNVSIMEEDGGYSAVCTDLDVASQGESVDEAVRNVKEAIELYLESAKETGMMDEVLEKLGLNESDFEAEIVIPKIFRTQIPIKISRKR
jgi:predicted RNase H-like HicB family nuclease